RCPRLRTQEGNAPDRALYRRAARSGRARRRGKATACGAGRPVRERGAGGMRTLTVAVAKGRLGEKAAPLFGAIGCDVTTLMDALDGGSRSLAVAEPHRHLKCILAKSMALPTYVEYGAADLGIVGKDVLMESERAVAELADLGYARCSFVLAVPEGAGIRSVEQLDYNCRVASKYPNVTRRFLARHGIQADVIPLHGS